MDYVMAMNWLTAIAFICGICAAGLVVLEIFSWTDEWRNQRAANKNSHAHPRRWWE